MFSTRAGDALPVRTVANSLCTTSKVFIIFSSIVSRQSCKVMAGRLKTQARIFNYQFTRMDTTAQTLLIDADDTLWENNIYFERVAADFVAALAERGIDPR